MGRSFFWTIVALLLLQACSKDGDGPTAGEQPIPVDTLAAGWSMVAGLPNVNFLDVFFVNSQVGFLGGNKYLAKSVDGGLTWTKLPLSDTTNFIGFNIFFTDLNHGWIASQEKGVFWTTDGGLTWNNSSGFIAYDVFFTDQNNGFVICNKAPSGLMRTSDGGKSWSIITSITSQISAIFLKDAGNGWAGSMDGKLFKTTDGFNTASLVVATPLLQHINYLQFADDFNGWATGFNGAELSRTTDGGVTWSTMLTPTSLPKDIELIDKQNGFALRINEVYKTTDGGQTFSRVVKSRGALVEIFFHDVNHGWACGDGGVMYRFAQ